MPWYGKYYYRSVRLNGKQKKLYVGHGLLGEVAAEADLRARESRQALRAALHRLREERRPLESDLNEFDRIVDRLARQALGIAGFHQHDKGQWRKKRGRNV